MRAFSKKREYDPTWTDEQRQQVETLSGYGLSNKQLAAVVGCSVQTLYAVFSREMALGSAKTTANVGKRFYEKALSGDNACMILWMKARAGWRTGDTEPAPNETPQINLTITDSNPIDAAKSYAMLMGTVPTTLEHQPVQDSNGAEDETGMYRNIMEDETKTPVSSENQSYRTE